MTTTLSVKSGKGLSHGVVSELAAFFDVVPGHEAELRAACLRFGKVVLEADPRELQKAGLRDVRFIMFDNDRRVILMTTFETDWEPYVDDAVMVLGPEHWRDWQQHCVGFDQYKEEPGLAALRSALQAAQIPAVAYYNMLADYTIPEIKKALRVDKAFQQTLDDPAGVEALQQPALKELLEQAAD
jgi:trans-2-enoyl-CoA reductase